MRSRDLPEALLELHYFPAFRKLLKNFYGRSVLRVLKPSQREEAFLGFDQGFVKTTISGSELRKQLANAIATPSAVAPSLYAGYFLQYKCVEQMTRRSKAAPPGYSTPYYRVELSLEPNKTTGISQHETLQRLQSLAGTDVSYACPMVFSEDDLWRDASLDDVRVVSLADAPQGWTTKKAHHIVFRARNDSSPFWCSDPIPGKSQSIREWLAAQLPELRTGAELLEWLNRVRSKLAEVEGETHLPSSLTIVEFSGSKQSDA